VGRPRLGLGLGEERQPLQDERPEGVRVVAARVQRGGVAEPVGRSHQLEPGECGHGFRESLQELDLGWTSRPQRSSLGAVQFHRELAPGLLAQPGCRVQHLRGAKSFDEQSLLPRKVDPEHAGRVAAWLASKVPGQEHFGCKELSQSPCLPVVERLAFTEVERGPGAHDPVPGDEPDGALGRLELQLEKEGESWPEPGCFRRSLIAQSSNGQGWPERRRAGRGVLPLPQRHGSQGREEERARRERPSSRPSTW